MEEVQTAAPRRRLGAEVSGRSPPIVAYRNLRDTALHPVRSQDASNFVPICRSDVEIAPPLPIFSYPLENASERNLRRKTEVILRRD